LPESIAKTAKMGQLLMQHEKLPVTECV